MNYIEIVIALIGTGLVSSIITVFTHKRLRKSEVKNNEAQAADLLARTYQGLIKSLNEQIQISKDNNQEQAAEVEKLRGINKRLEAGNNSLTTKINELEEELDGLRKQITRLTSRLKKYEDDQTKKLTSL